MRMDWKTGLLIALAIVAHGYLTGHKVSYSGKDESGVVVSPLGGVTKLRPTY
jgi:hypothetical protein